MSERRIRTVGILIFDDVEVLDFCGPFEVFSVARPAGEDADDPPLDILVVPGGQGTRRERANARLLDWIAAQDRDVELTTSVCTGAFLLAERGLLDGRRATTHWASVEWMRGQYPAVTMLADARVVDEGHVITSAGVAAGIDMALHVVARLHGEETAAWTARRMEYDRTPTGRVPTTP